MLRRVLITGATSAHKESQENLSRKTLGWEQVGGGSGIQRQEERQVQRPEGRDVAAPHSKSPPAPPPAPRACREI